MKIKNCFWIAGLFLSLAVMSCYDDKGNYDYREIEQTYVFNGFENGYEKAVGDILEIYPTIVNGGDPLGDTARYEYRWTAQRELYREGVNNQQYVIGRGPNLYYQIDLPNIDPDQYLITLHMKDKESGIEWTKSTYLRITGSLQEGWLLLCDRKGKAELNIYARKSDESMMLMKNVLEKSGFPYITGPRKVMYEDNSNTSDGKKIWILTDGGTGWLTKGDYQWKEDQLMKYRMLEPVGNDYTCADITQFSMVVFQLEDDTHGNGVQTLNFQNAGSIFSGNIAVYDKGLSSFTVEPYVAGNYSNPTVAGGILYDRDNRQFVMCLVNAGTLPEECVRLSDNPKWNVGKKMLYMQSTASQNRSFGLFEVEGSDDVLECEFALNAEFSMSIMNFVTKPVYNKDQIYPNATHLKNAKFRAYHMTEGYLYYVDGNTLYTWYEGQERVLRNFTDGEVTALHCQYVKTGDTKNSEYLLVATYQEDENVPEDKWGNLYFFATDGASPVNLSQKNKLTGVGKVVDIDYQLK